MEEKEKIFNLKELILLIWNYKLLFLLFITVFTISPISIYDKVQPIYYMSDTSVKIGTQKCWEKCKNNSDSIGALPYEIVSIDYEEQLKDEINLNFPGVGINIERGIISVAGPKTPTLEVGVLKIKEIVEFIIQKHKETIIGLKSRASKDIAIINQLEKEEINKHERRINFILNSEIPIIDDQIDELLADNQNEINKQKRRKDFIIDEEIPIIDDQIKELLANIKALEIKLEEVDNERYNDILEYELPAISGKIDLLSMVILQDNENIRLLKSDQESLINRAMTSPSLEEVVHNYKMKMLDLKTFEGKLLIELKALKENQNLGVLLTINDRTSKIEKNIFNLSISVSDFVLRKKTLLHELDILRTDKKSILFDDTNIILRKESLLHELEIIKDTIQSAKFHFVQEKNKKLLLIDDSNYQNSFQIGNINTMTRPLPSAIYVYVFISFIASVLVSIFAIFLIDLFRRSLKT